MLNIVKKVEIAGGSYLGYREIIFYDMICRRPIMSFFEGWFALRIRNNSAVGISKLTSYQVI